MTLSDKTTLQAPQALEESEATPASAADECISLDQPAEDLDLNTLSKIRELLFGQQARSQEQQLAQLEARVERNYAALQDQISNRLEALEQSMQKNLQTLTQQIESNHTAQAATAQGHQEQIAALKTQLTQIGDHLQQKHEELRATLDREVQALQTIDQGDRDQLATLFHDLATQLGSHP
ncbi:MAG: hypothetical protein HC934_09735 [Acaryochloridaceae cyanobacterium SU_2_1]|nr:hypothetical protein [Acaryochloridaceae cyanobacterium SU_2_1]